MFLPVVLFMQFGSAWSKFKIKPDCALNILNINFIQNHNWFQICLHIVGYSISLFRYNSKIYSRESFKDNLKILKPKTKSNARNDSTQAQKHKKVKISEIFKNFTYLRNSKDRANRTKIWEHANWSVIIIRIFPKIKKNQNFQEIQNFKKSQYFQNFQKISKKLNLQLSQKRLQIEKNRCQMWLENLYNYRTMCRQWACFLQKSLTCLSLYHLIWVNPRLITL